MTFTITEVQFYIGVIVLLMVVQVYHHSRVEKLKVETEKLWNQIAIIATTLSLHLATKEKQESEKQDKE